MKNMHVKLGALIITYKPDMSKLCESIRSIENQVNGICIIDNGGLNDSLLPSCSCEVIIKHLEKNFGIATATNIGFSLLLEKSVNYILLCDQDTIFPYDYIPNFLNYIKANDISLCAAFCPVFFDQISFEYKPVYVLRKGIIKKEKEISEPCNVYQSIASGLIIDTDKLRIIGGMNEDLFIDYVDFEWCWKINYSGYTVLCLPQMKISHCLGDSIVNFAGKKISSHNSIRNYYITRNTLFLSMHSPYLGFFSRIQLFIKACLYPIGYTVCCKPHLKNARFTMKGIFDAIFCKLGEFSW